MEIFNLEYACFANPLANLVFLTTILVLSAKMLKLRSITCSEARVSLDVPI